MTRACSIREQRSWEWLAPSAHVYFLHQSVEQLTGFICIPRSGEPSYLSSALVPIVQPLEKFEQKVWFNFVRAKNQGNVLLQFFLQSFSYVTQSQILVEVPSIHGKFLLHPSIFTFTFKVNHIALVLGRTQWASQMPVGRMEMCQDVFTLHRQAEPIVLCPRILWRKPYLKVTKHYKAGAF